MHRPALYSAHPFSLSLSLSLSPSLSLALSLSLSLPCTAAGSRVPRHSQGSHRSPQEVPRGHGGRNP